MENQINSPEFHRVSLDVISDYVFLVEAESHRVIEFNGAVIGNLGYDRSELFDMTLFELTETTPETLDEYVEQIQEENTPFLINLTLKKKNGSALPCSVNIFKPGVEAGTPVYAASFKDIKERLTFEKTLYSEKEKALVTLQAIDDAVLSLNTHGNIDYMNPSAETLLDTSLIKSIGKPVSSILRLQSGEEHKSEHDIVRMCLEQKESVQLKQQDLRIWRSDNKIIYVETTASPLFSRDGTLQGMVIVIRNVTSARRMQQKLLWQATHDPLTGLVNRRQFEEELTQALDQSISMQEVSVMMYIDLDQFKLVNDIVGHIAGDELLKQLTSILSLNLNHQNILARLGGDEFGVIMRNATIEKAKPVAEKLIEVVQGFRFQWGKGFYKVGASIGMVPIHRESISLTHIMSMADLACDTAKELGRNRVHVYIGGELDYHKRQGEMKWVARIKEALEKNQFILYRQPIVPIEKNGTNNPCHYEILLRMTSPDGSIIPPDDFLPAANRYNLMNSIDKWVLKHTFQTIALEAEKKGEEARNITYAVNLSGSSLSDDSFSFFILELFQKYKIDPTRICFEVTENETIQNFHAARNFMIEMKSEGCKFALDDFGAGLSSFGYLKSLPVDILKIDGAFVKDVLKDKIDMAMLEAINQIGHIMNLKTIAEYVENLDIYNALLKIGVDYAQGYAIRKPEPFSRVLPMG